MKFTVNVDCTPEEARAFLGLPDVQPMQKAMLAEMEKRMMAEMERFSPESLMKTWFAAGSQSADMVRDMMGGLFSSSVPGDGKK